jgi:hypothetical protein
MAKNKKGSKKGKKKSSGMSAKERKRLKNSDFAFPEDRKMPLNDASHVRNAAARFGQVKGASKKARDRAWKRIQKAAKRMNVKLSGRGKKRKKK